MQAHQTQKSIDQLKILIRQKSILGLEAISKKQELQIDTLSIDDKVLGHWMSVITVSGDKIHITFKVQFSIKTANEFSKHTFKHVKEAISNSQNKDFMREFCNMTAGYIKNTLINNGLVVGVSLPLLCRGFDNFFFEPSIHSISGKDCWKLSELNNSIYCSSVIDLADNLILHALEDSEIQTGDVEFL